MAPSFLQQGKVLLKKLADTFPAKAQLSDGTTITSTGLLSDIATQGDYETAKSLTPKHCIFLTPEELPGSLATALSHLVKEKDAYKLLLSTRGNSGGNHAMALKIEKTPSKGVSIIFYDPNKTIVYYKMVFRNEHLITEHISSLYSIK